MFTNSTYVFTTLLVQESTPLWLQEHLHRLHAHASALGIPIPSELSFQFPPGTYLARISLRPSGYQLETRPYQPQDPAIYANGVSVVLTSEISPGPYKTDNRSAYQKAYRIAQEHHAFEALLLDQDGFVVDGTKSSLLLIQNKIVTLIEGGIDGITRQQLAHDLSKQGYQICRKKLKPHELQGQLWLAGTGFGAVAIRSLHVLKPD